MNRYRFDDGKTYEYGTLIELEPDTFVYKGKTYRVVGFAVKEISPEPEGQVKKEGIK